MNKKHAIFVLISGGLAQDVFNIPADVEIHVIDYDVGDQSDADRIAVSPLDGEPCCISIFSV
jgi:hypothetical protein